MGKIEDNRPRGRSSKRWCDQVADILAVPVSIELHLVEDKCHGVG